MSCIIRKNRVATIFNAGKKKPQFMFLMVNFAYKIFISFEYKTLPYNIPIKSVSPNIDGIVMGRLPVILIT